MLQYNNGVVQLGLNEPLCQMKAAPIIVRTPVLLSTKKDVSARRAFNPRFEAPALIEKYNPDAPFSTGFQKGRATANMTEKDNPL